MKLHFETQPQITRGKEIPVLVDNTTAANNIPAEAVVVDGEELVIDEKTLATFQEVVSRMYTEKLPAKHFRDCLHFVMAMNDLWLPTHRPSDRRQTLTQVCDDTVPVTEHQGPISFCIPNDGRCLGFERQPYVYSHSALGVSTSKGVMYLHKLGAAPIFSLSSFGQAMDSFENEIAHPITKLSVGPDGLEMVWTADESDRNLA